MTTPLDSLQLYTRILTGMVLLRNVGLLLAIRMAVKFARIACEGDTSEFGVRRWSMVKKGLAALILLVVCMNGAAVFANNRLVGATHEIAAELPMAGAVSDVALSQPVNSTTLSPADATASK